MRTTNSNDNLDRSQSLRVCAFLDRDGVINAAPLPGQYITKWDEFHFIPGIADWIKLLNALGLLVIVITNQRGVAKGIVPLDRLEWIHERMVQELAKAGARIDDVFFCPHEQGECGCRKPLPGLIHQAEQRWHIDLRRSIFLGDSENDRLLAANCGLTFVRVEAGRVTGISAERGGSRRDGPSEHPAQSPPSNATRHTK